MAGQGRAKCCCSPSLYRSSSSPCLSPFPFLSFLLAALLPPPSLPPPPLSLPSPSPHVLLTFYAFNFCLLLLPPPPSSCDTKGPRLPHPATRPSAPSGLRLRPPLRRRPHEEGLPPLLGNPGWGGAARPARHQRRPQGPRHAGQIGLPSFVVFVELFGAC